MSSFLFVKGYFVRHSDKKICSLCTSTHKEWKDTTGNSTLRAHLEKHHPKEFNELRTAEIEAGKNITNSNTKRKSTANAKSKSESDSNSNSIAMEDRQNSSLKEVENGNGNANSTLSSSMPALVPPSFVSSMLLPLPPVSHSSFSSYSFSTSAVHADDNMELFRPQTDVAPPIHFSTTYQYPSSPSALRPLEHNPCYSRENYPTIERCETVLQSILHAPTCIYNSGLAAIHALFTHLAPKRVWITKAEVGGYHGTMGVLELFVRTSGVIVLKLEDLTARRNTNE